MAQTENSISIAAPREVVWATTNNVRTWPELFTEYAAVEVIAEVGDTVRFRLEMHPDEQGQVWSWVSERTVDPATWTVSAHRVETGPFEHMHIRWAYTEADGVTTMVWKQDFHMKSGAPVDDDTMTARINANSGVQMRIIKERIERDHAAVSATPQ
ncbi:SRPBCC family protein [Nocardia sp. alder85J]|uniref:SRPBCC family protein n=1 Tax=Nocardia sp. alder85J TaxID=2862949 RepID=UPI001CD574B0|nr:SRPBCC family protein [Nocardia sp. alder85J]MCX4094705.1 SRPBCC family protein [Nocardia sp. alder85J]